MWVKKWLDVDSVVVLFSARVTFYIRFSFQLRTKAEMITLFGAKTREKTCDWRRTRSRWNKRIQICAFDCLWFMLCSYFSGMNPSSEPEPGSLWPALMLWKLLQILSTPGACCGFLCCYLSLSAESLFSSFTWVQFSSLLRQSACSELFFLLIASTRPSSVSLSCFQLSSLLPCLCSTSLLRQ